MTLEFKKHVERRDTVNAARFLEPGQAADIADVLGGSEFHMKQDHLGFTLTVGDHVIQRGDYIVESYDPERRDWRMSVVPGSVFRLNWELPD